MRLIVKGLEVRVQKTDSEASATVEQLLSGKDSECINTLGNSTLRKVAQHSAEELKKQGDTAGAAKLADRATAALKENKLPRKSKKKSRTIYKRLKVK